MDDPGSQYSSDEYSMGYVKRTTACGLSRRDGIRSGRLASERAIGDTRQSEFVAVAATITRAQPD